MKNGTASSQMRLHHQRSLCAVLRRSKERQVLDSSHTIIRAYEPRTYICIFTFLIFSLIQWTAYGDEETIKPSALHSQFFEEKKDEKKETVKVPVEITVEQLPDRTVRAYHPKPAKFFPEGNNTFWVALFVDGYVCMSTRFHRLDRVLLSILES